MEGYPDSVKFLHNNPNWNHTAPILSDIIYVKEAYRAAVENVLEPYLNYYIVNNLEEGLQAIHLAVMSGLVMGGLLGSIYDLDLLELLIKHGAKVNCKDHVNDYLRFFFLGV